MIRIICLSFLVFCSWVLVGTVSYFITGEDLGIHLKESPHLIVSILPDGRVAWRPDGSESELVALPESLLYA